MHYQPGGGFLLSSKLDGSVPFLSAHLNMFLLPVVFISGFGDDVDQTLFISFFTNLFSFFSGQLF